ncbi:hypothetical protein Nmel_003373 [Mimus melanotis]
MSRMVTRIQGTPAAAVWTEDCTCTSALSVLVCWEEQGFRCHCSLLGRIFLNTIAKIKSSFSDKCCYNSCTWMNTGIVSTASTTVHWICQVLPEISHL